VALREIRRPWTRQPQGADVRLADWVGGRMLALTVGGNVPPAPLLYAGSGGPAQATPDGLALAGAAEVSGPGNGQLLHGGGQPLTCLAMVRVLSGSGGAGNTCVFSGPSGASSGDIVGIARGGYVWQFQARNDYGGPFVQQAWTTDGATAQPIAGRVFLLVGRALSATDTRLTTLELTGKRRRDETIDTTNTGSLVFDEWGTATLGRDGHDQLLYGALISGWAISDEQISELHANPWALFAPRRIWVPVSSGGGSEDYSGGGDAVVVISAAGEGTAAEHAAGGGDAAVSVLAVGEGAAAEHASGGSDATVHVAAAGAGTAAEHASGGGDAVVQISAEGEGFATEDGAEHHSGGGDAVVQISAIGEGTAAEHASGGGAAVVHVVAAGEGTDGAAGDEVISLGWFSRNGNLVSGEDVRVRELARVQTIVVQVLAVVAMLGEMDA
jgi:hypothetical protein